MGPYSQSLPGRSEDWRRVRRSPLRLFLQGVVMTALIGGTTAFVNLDKDLVLSVDGKVTQVHSFARTVGDVLVHQGIQVGTHDTVAPTRAATISDGTRKIGRASCREKGT